MPEGVGYPDPRAAFQRMMGRPVGPGDLQTPEGYWYATQPMPYAEAGTFGRVDPDRPLVSVREGAKPHEYRHELAHINQMYQPGGIAALDEGYNARQLAARYQTYGLTPEEAQDLAYGMRPSEIAARKYAGDPSDVFERLLARVEAIEAARARRPPRAPTPTRTRATGGLGGAAARAQAARAMRGNR